MPELHEHQKKIVNDLTKTETRVISIESKKRVQGTLHLPRTKVPPKSTAMKEALTKALGPKQVDLHPKPLKRKVLTFNPSKRKG